MKHSEMAYGKCARRMSATAEKMRWNAQHLYPKISGKTGSSSLDLFDHVILSKAVRTVGGSQWDRQCSKVIGDSQVYKVDHDCAAVATNNTFRWQVPLDVHEGGPAEGSKTLLNGPWG